jgi:DNA-damage-inducible protein J
MAHINIRTSDDLKSRAEMLCEEIGITLSAAINMFLTQSVREHRLPLSLSPDPFYSESNQRHIVKAIEDYESGQSKPIIKTMAELEAMANG